MDTNTVISTLFYPLFLSILLYYFLTFLTLPGSKPGFKRNPVLGTTLDFLANRHRFLEWSTDILSALPTHTSPFFRPLGGTHGVFIADPENVEHILKTRFHIYPKGTRFIAILHDFLGSGIFNSDGPLWRLQRKTASFEFNKRTLKTFLIKSVIQPEVQTRLTPVLRDAVQSGRVLDLQDVFERFAFDNVCKLAFNVDPGCLDRDGPVQFGFMRAFNEATEICSGRFMYALPMSWKIKRFFNFGSERKLRDAIRTVHRFADEIIRRRLDEKLQNINNNNKYEDLLTRFIDNDESSVELLRDVVISVILAGKETTSTGLSWLFWLLSINPNVVEKIRTEVDTIRVRSTKRVGEPFDYEELQEMQYLHAVVSESLRLYPPVPVDTKACLEDDVLPDGTRVHKGWFVLYHAYAMGRMESIWGKDCLEFRPDRWLDENGLFKPDSSFRFPVFHAGPRVCLGKEMAYIQMKSIVASVVEQFEVDVLEKEKRPTYLLSLTLKIKDGLPVRLRERKTSY